MMSIIPKRISRNEKHSLKFKTDSTAEEKINELEHIKEGR